MRNYEIICFLIKKFERRGFILLFLFFVIIYIKLRRFCKIYCLKRIGYVIFWGIFYRFLIKCCVI